MPAGIAASDKKLLLVAGSILAVLLGATAFFSPQSDTFQSPFPSTYSSQSGGAAAAYRLLSALHYPVRRWINPPTALPADLDDANVLLILAEPAQPPTEKERAALAQFVEDGGHVLFTGANIQIYFPEAVLPDEKPDPKWETFTPNLPSPLVRDAKQITLQPQAYWGKLRLSQLAVYGDPDSPVVVSWAVGEGQIVWVAGSTPLTNAGITRDDNLPFFLNAVANWSEDPYQIYWDEYFHGARNSLWSYVARTAVSWAVLQLAVLLAAVLFTFSRRSGPIFLPAPVSRLSPLEFVDTLGGLYERASAAAAAVSVSYTRTRALLTRQLALPSNTPSSALGTAAEQRLGWKNSTLGLALTRAEVAMREPKLRPEEALGLVQDLDTFAAKLDVRAQLAREKT